MQLDRPPTGTARHYARGQGGTTAFTASLAISVIDKKRFPVLEAKAQTDVRTGKTPMTSAATRDREAVGAVMSAFAPGANYGRDTFKAPVTGRYRVRVAGYTVWVGSSPDGRGRDGQPVSRKHLPNNDDVSGGRRGEPVTVFTINGPNNRTLTAFDLTPEPAVHDLGDLWLVAGEQLATDPSRLFRRRYGEARNPLAQGDGVPAVAFQWLEVEGPVYDDPTASPGYRLLFGDLPVRPAKTALENFDVFGGWRDRYRAVAEDTAPAPGRMKEGYSFSFAYGPPADPAGEFRASRFSDIREFKHLLRAEEARVARNLLGQLVVYATGTPVRFSDRGAAEAVLVGAKDYGVRSLIHGLVQSDLFRDK
jgi:hypothetical protein